jgi:hypothetical protein
VEWSILESPVEGVVEAESGKRRVPDAGTGKGMGRGLISSGDMYWIDDGMYCVLRRQTMGSCVVAPGSGDQAALS